MTATIGSRRVTSLAAAALALALAAPAAAQISGVSSSNAGSTCTGGNDADGFCGSSTQVLTNNGTTFQSRYAWNVNADTGALSTRDESGNATHTLNFSATAPGGYRLDISTSRTGALGRGADVSNCDGQAHTSGVTGSSNVALNSGSLGNPAAPADIGNGGGDTNAGYGPLSTTATIFRVSNGAAQTHTLTFTWNGSVRSNSCEASVRQGQQNGTTSGCNVCGYPGSPSRTQSSDGHFVTVTFTSLCGNGVVDSSVGEDCDPPNSTCCTSLCKFASSSTVCRPSAGVCDPQETCTGSSATCPGNSFSPSTTVCRASAGPCDPAENCTGSTAACPADALSPSSTVCRPSAGVCDVAENCTGSSAACPANAFVPSTTVCRASGGVCDVAENCTGSTAACPADAKSTDVCRPATDLCDAVEACDGVSDDCPADVLQPSTFQCRGAAGVCDVAENCTGSSPACPPDGKSMAVCRPSAGDCDVPESCDGVGDNCPADAFQPSTLECRASAGVCDVAENCTGSSATCPPDAKSTAECRPSAGVCDLADNCDGVNDACPPDAKSTALCRPATDLCDAPESCDGVADNCPVDQLRPSTDTCRAAAGPCDIAENCTGSSAACPADAFQPSSVVCRPSSGACDAAESCSGLAASCPPDLAAPDNTPCNDGSTCTVADHCEAGSCVGSPTLDTCLDDFLCYKAKVTSGTPKFVGTSVHLVDDFEDQMFSVVKPRQLCTPADKQDGNGTVDPATHIESYQIRSISGVHTRRHDIRVNNQLAIETHVDTVRPDILFVPTAKDLANFPPPPDNNTINVDHYKCYKIKTTSGTPKFPKGVSVQVTDQFTVSPKTLQLRKPRHLCIPVDKNDEGVKNSNASLLCYSAKPATKFSKRTGLYVANQFGQLRLDAVKEGEFCIPSTRSPSGAFLDVTLDALD